MAGQTFYPQSGYLFPDPAFVHMRQLKLYSNVGAVLPRNNLLVNSMVIAA